MARLNFPDFSTLWVAFGFRLFQAAYFINIQQLASNQDFSFFRCKRKQFLKILRKIEKIKTRHSRESNHGSPAFRASALTIRLPCIYVYIYIYTNHTKLQSDIYPLNMPFTAGKDTGSSSSHCQWHLHFINNLQVQKKIKKKINR